VPLIVKDLYKNEVTAFAKRLTEPLADSLFRTPPVPPEVAIEEVIGIAERRTFDVDSLPVRVIRPTYEHRKWKLRNLNQPLHVGPDYLAAPVIWLIRPTLQRIAHISLVACTIVYASNARLVTTHMIKDRLDDVRLHAKLGHAGGAGAT